VELPGGWVSIPLAAAIAAAGSMVREQRARRAPAQEEELLRRSPPQGELPCEVSIGLVDGADASRLVEVRENDSEHANLVPSRRTYLRFDVRRDRERRRRFPCRVVLQEGRA